MPTDEQRKQFEKWADKQVLWQNFDVSIEWTGGQYNSLELDLAWDAFRAGQLARDAEVQALREALESVHYRATRWEVLPTVEAHQSVLKDIGEDARAALAGGETGETE